MNSATPQVFRIPLAQQHLAAGAALSVYHGAEIPLKFADSTTEYRAARNSAGLFDFSFRSKFTLTGEHSARFLHRIVSNDIKVLAPGQGTYATLLSPQGRILADLRIYLADDRIWVDTDADLAEKAMSNLQRYIIGDRVQIEPSSVLAVAIQGPAAWAAIEGILGPGIAPLEREMDHRAVTCQGQSARLVRLSSTGDEGYEIWLDEPAISSFWQAALDAGKSLPLVPCGSEALETLRIEAGIARYGPDLAEDTLPLEAGLLSALSFNKGCYIGQEIVERARSRGHVNWNLMGLRLEPGAGLPKPGETASHDGKTVAEVTSACYSPLLDRPIALAYLRREVSEPGTKLPLAESGVAEVCTLPFLKAKATPDGENSRRS